MLLKYLNELEHAIEAARRDPDFAHFCCCADAHFVVHDYLQGQIEPVRRRGEAIVERLLPSEFDSWMMQVAAGRSARPCVNADRLAR